MNLNVIALKNSIWLIQLSFKCIYQFKVICFDTLSYLGSISVSVRASFGETGKTDVTKCLSFEYHSEETYSEQTLWSPKMQNKQTHQQFFEDGTTLKAKNTCDETNALLF